ncbi:LOW QUALITY PROTEIN: sialidase-4-like, partial [Callorhinchus milii]|uniref:LOW QUALITY PROTEIN: sialidase-4-like n=1 Tax=Callorhinchus milii TaxID=7868 RepID=UPI001C3FD89C
LLYIEESKTFLAMAEKQKSSNDVDARGLVLRRGHLQNQAVQGLLLWDLVPCMTGTSESCSCSSPGSGPRTQWGRGMAYRWPVAAWWYAVRYAYLIQQSHCMGKSTYTHPHSLYLYSEDHGQTWLVSELVSELQTLECEAAEITRPDASPQLYLNTRIKKQGLRAEVVSLEPGSLHKPTLAQELVETGYNGCQGSVVSFPGPSPSPTHSNNQPFWLVFTHPTDKKDRVDLGMYVNLLSHPTPGWSKPWLINRGPSAYSDLAYVATCRADDMGAFGCLFKRGDSNYEQIVFCLFTVRELMEHVCISDSGP